MSAVEKNWQATLARVRDAAHAAGRDANGVHVLAVSKTFPLDAVLEAADAGATAFGENYVQEGVAKILALRALAAREGSHDRPQSPRYQSLSWHFIGPLQSNKTREVAEHFDWVHSIDRLKIAQRLSAQRPPELAPLNVCVQVNVSDEASKSGVTPSEAVDLAHAVAALPRLRLRGLMAIPEPQPDVARQRQAFAVLRALYEHCRSQGLALDTLSMGMSADLEAAIAEGATIVRVGTAIFGTRTPKTALA
ncbi:MAG TPA: YggS family pyridoxal phosphate-dependent enzyme [Burkholderiaceae bacterium]|nr:YggS family pyridoxal phosphate-dependent enzyme [Burkholderiaceae bacterium]